MNLQTTKHPYRLLLQINDDGSIGSSISFKLKTTDTDTGAVISVTELPVTDLDKDGGEWDLDNVLGDVLSKSVIAAKILQNENDALKESVSALEVTANNGTVNDGGTGTASKNSVLKVLDAHDYYDAVMSLISAAPRSYQIDFQTATTVHRNHALVLAVIDSGLFTAEQADVFFKEAIALDQAAT